jgi:hypothetical protein
MGAIVHKRFYGMRHAHGKNKRCPLSPLFLSYIFILSLPTIDIISAYLE